MDGGDRQTDAGLALLLDRIVPYYHPDAVYLFGSRAEGRAGPDSDYDLLVVVPDDAAEDRLSRVAGRAEARKAGLPADVIPIPRSEFERRKDQIGTLCYAAWHRGRLVHGRQGEPSGARACPFLSGDGTVRQDVVREWLATVGRDLLGARYAIEAAEPVPEIAAFLCQQAAEKLVKSVMILNGVEPRKQHDIGELIKSLPAATVERYRLAPLAALTDYAFAFRYADWVGPKTPVPSPADLAAWIADLERRIKAMVATANADEGAS